MNAFVKRRENVAWDLLIRNVTYQWRTNTQGQDSVSVFMDHSWTVVSLGQMNIFSNTAKEKKQPQNSQQALGATMMLDQCLPLLTQEFYLKKKSGGKTTIALLEFAMRLPA